jgi:glutathionylspermidine synthase
MTFLFLLSSIFFQMDTAPLANYRMVLVFGNNPTLVQQQLSALQKDSSGFAERDLIVQQVKPADKLHQTYHITPNEPFTVILIGKDGGEKYRSASILTADRLFAMVDAMPMRQAEMRRTKNQ